MPLTFTCTLHPVSVTFAGGMAAQGGRAGRHWHLEAAGFPCEVELEKGGVWVVTLASITVGRDENLVQAIWNAGGGLIKLDEAQAVAASVAGA
jgi:hypothetical protein